jgi:VanZ family protein
MPVLKQYSSWRGRFIRYAPLILWAGVIFFLSSSMGAASNTSRIIRPLLLWLFPDIIEPSIQAVHYYVRKTAHFTEYAILASLAVLTFKNSSREILKNWRYLFAVLLTALVATIDETNQSFLNSRTGAVEDVLLDISGGVTAVLLIFLLGKLWKSRQS